MHIDKKAQEISFALIKISVYARRLEFRKRLEKLAFQLLEEVSRRNYEPVFRTSMALEGLIRFGSAIYEIEPVNSDILLQELADFNLLVKQMAEASLPDSNQVSDISLVFTSEKKTAQHNKKSSHTESKISSTDSGSSIPILKKEKNSQDIVLKQSNGGEDNPAIRQSAIIEKIRQSGNIPIKLKALVSEFPKFSERTIRYDIQRLCNQGILERVGSGGPATYYKVREI